MKTFKKAAVPLAVALAFAGHLYAQPADPATEPASADPNARLSAEDMARNAQEFVSQVRADTQHVQHLQAVARAEKDVIKLSCVNDKFIKLKAEANLFDAAQGELSVSLAGSGRFAAYGSVTAARDQVRKLREEAERCVGEIDMLGDSTNTFTKPDFTDDPTSGLPFDDNNTTIEPPGYASPYN